MNKFTFVASVCAALFFAACGDDSSSVEPSLDESSSSVVKSSSSTATKKSSSSSSVKSSSSTKVSSSSNKVESSSSAKASSSSTNTPLSSWSGGEPEAIGSITDTRDGQTYKTVIIGTQTWMAQNLNYETADSYCYDDKASNCAKYGRLYKWAAATSACPSDWHLPTKAEFETLFATIGGKSLAGTKLKSTTGWISSGNGTDAYSFSALPAGLRYFDGSYDFEGNYAYFWSSTEDNRYSPYYLLLYYGYGVGARLIDNKLKNYGFSVRCVKD